MLTEMEREIEPQTEMDQVYIHLPPQIISLHVIDIALLSVRVCVCLEKGS